MKKEQHPGESRREHNPVEARSEEAVELAERLAPLEETHIAGEYVRTGESASGRRIVVDTGQLKVPREFIEEDEEGKVFGLEPVVILILFIVLAFIGFIAYLIHLEPPG